jgi:apolipoprotein N-acyltransferase
MRVELSPPPPQTTPSVDRSVEEIIASARAQQRRQTPGAPFRQGLLLSVTTGLLLWASFFPLNWGPLAWLAPVPLLLLARTMRPVRRLYVACYLGGLAFYLPALQWMRLGDPTMYLAWWALAAYLAVSFPLQVALSRVAIHRWGVPLVVAAPVVWVGLDYAKAHLLSGFAWYFLAHTQYRWLELIQVSDIFGAYGVTFVMTLSAAALAGWIPAARLRWLGLSSDEEQAASAGLGLLPARTAPVWIAAAVLALTLGYGVVRRSQADFQPGPRVALIQGNFLASLRIPEEDFNRQYLTHLKLTAYAVREQPDVIVWPEGMVRWPLTSAPADLSDDDLRRLAPKAPPRFWRDQSLREGLAYEAQRSGAAMIFGIGCVDLTPTGEIRQANSAILVRPDTGIAGRYDKIHLVPFGEYLPFQTAFPWLQALTPYPPDFGLTAGTATAVFEYRGWRLAPIICFEDTVPHLVRRVVAYGYDSAQRRPVDVLVNLTNDGWFRGSSELDQHLVTAAFRAVECRTPLIRAVNTGISAVIDGDGAILDPEVFLDGDQQGRTTARDPHTGRWHKQLNVALVTNVPLDPRDSLYVRFGDWFAGLCSACALFWGLSGLSGGRRRGLEPIRSTP